jgi:multicomponent K+:H+ antiporter subunit E
MSVLLLGTWLLLDDTLSAGQVAFGCLLALVGPLAMAALEPPRLRLRHPRAAVRLSLRALADIVRSNFAVARLILVPGKRRRHSGFVAIPLKLRDPYGLAALACIITATPGTIWVEYDAAAAILTIHVLDLVDENAWIGTIKHRYERLLLEIFE